jgi:hypothetical protein
MESTRTFFASFIGCLWFRLPVSTRRHRYLWQIFWFNDFQWSIARYEFKKEHTSVLDDRPVKQGSGSVAPFVIIKASSFQNFCCALAEVYFYRYNKLCQINDSRGEEDILSPSSGFLLTVENSPQTCRFFSGLRWGNSENILILFAILNVISRGIQFCRYLNAWRFLWCQPPVCTETELPTVSVFSMQVILLVMEVKCLCSWITWNANSKWGWSK